MRHWLFVDVGLVWVLTYLCLLLKIQMAWVWGLRPVIPVLRSWSRRTAVTSRPAWVIAWNLVLQATQNTRKKNLLNTTTNHKFSIQNSSLQYGASSLPRSRLHSYSTKPCFLVQCSESSGEPKSLGAVLLGAVTHSFLSLFLYWLLSFREKVNRKKGRGTSRKRTEGKVVFFYKVGSPEACQNSVVTSSFQRSFSKTILSLPETAYILNPL